MLSGRYSSATQALLLSSGLGVRLMISHLLPPSSDLSPAYAPPSRHSPSSHQPLSATLYQSLTFRAWSCSHPVFSEEEPSPLRLFKHHCPPGRRHCPCLWWHTQCCCFNYVGVYCVYEALAATTKIQDMSEDELNQGTLQSLKHSDPNLSRLYLCSEAFRGWIL